MEHRTLETLQGELHYWTEGEGRDTLVFLHGLGEDHQVFAHQMPFFTPNFRVIFLDLPGHGMSRPFQDFTLSDAAEALHRIMIREEVEALHLVGYAEGGYLAQEYAATHAGRLRSLTIISAMPFGKAYQSTASRFWLRGGEAMTRILPKGMKDAATGLRARTRQGRSHLAKGRAVLTNEELARVQAVFCAGYVRRTEVLNLRVPVYLVTGERDANPVIRKLLRRWSDQEGHLLDVVSRAGNAAHLDQPEEFNEKLMGFLDRVVKPRDFSNVSRMQHAMLDDAFYADSKDSR